MAIALNDNIKVNAPKPSEERYLNGIISYSSTTDADLATIGRRYTGLTVNINGEEYWYKTTIADGGLIAKSFAAVNGISGTGTTNNLPKWGSISGLTNSIIYDNGLKTTIGANIFYSKLTLYGVSSLDDNALTQIWGSRVSKIGLQVDGSYVFGLDSSVGNTERMRLTTNGNLLINTTTDNGIDKLQVSGSVISTGGYKLSGGTSSQFLMADGSTATGATDSNAVHKTGNETIAGTKTFGGGVGTYRSVIDPTSTAYFRALNNFNNTAFQIIEIGPSQGAFRAGTPSAYLEGREAGPQYLSVSVPVQSPDPTALNHLVTVNYLNTRLTGLSPTFTGTTNYISKFDSNSALTNSSIIDTGSLVTINNSINITGTTTIGGVTTISGGLKYTQAIGSQGVDLNTFVTAGFYVILDAPNAPTAGYYYLTVERMANSQVWVHQIAASFGQGNTLNKLYSRTCNNGGWGPWVEIITSNGGVINGSLTATTFVKLGGTANQFLMANGSVSTGITTLTYWSAGTGINAISVIGNNNIASGDYSLAEGVSTSATSIASHSEGYNTLASDLYSHAEGNHTISNGISSHSEGTSTFANGDYSHAGGVNSQALGLTSFVHGNNSIANNTNTIVFGANITGNASDTTYVDNFNIKTVPTGYSSNLLAIDASGNVITTTLSSVSGITGSGTTNYIPKFTSSGTITNSILSDTGNTIVLQSSLTATATTDIFDAYSNNILRTSLRPSGIQTWYLNSGAAEVGSINYSTPSGDAGIVFVSYSGARTDIRLNSQLGGLGFVTSSTSGTGTNQLTLLTNGNLLVGTTSDNGNMLQVNGNIWALKHITSGGNNGQVVLGDGTLGTYGAVGAGTTNYVPKYISASAIGNSRVFDNGKNIAVDNIWSTLNDDLVFGYLPSQRVIGVEDSISTHIGRDLVLHGGRAINFTYNTGKLSRLNSLPPSGTWLATAVNSQTNDVYAIASGAGQDIYKQAGGVGSFLPMGKFSTNFGNGALAVNHLNGDLYVFISGSGVQKSVGGTGLFTVIAGSNVNSSINAIAINPSNGDLWIGAGQGTGNFLWKQTGGIGAFVAQGLTLDCRGIAVNPNNGDVYVSGYYQDIYKQIGGTGSFVAVGAGANQYYYGIGINLANNDVYVCSLAVANILKQSGSSGSFVSTGQIINKSVRSISINQSNGDIYTHDGNTGGDIYIMQTIDSGTPDLNGGILKLKAGTGKGAGQSRVQVITGQQTVSGNNMHNEQVVAQFDESGNTTFYGNIIKASGTSSQYLMADGSISTLSGISGITGTGVANQVAFFNSNNSISGSTGFTWDNTNQRLGINGTPAFPLEVFSLASLTSGVDNIFRVNGNSVSIGIIINNTKSDNTGQTALYFQKKGVITYGFGSDINVTGTKDFYIWDNTNNINPFYITNTGEVRIGTSGIASTGGFTNAQKLTVKTNGNILIGSVSDSGDRLQVSGTSRFITSGATGTTVLISSTTQSSLVVVGSGNSTTLPIFSVQGSQGELFSVNDSLTGSLFSVNDISGLPVIEAFSDSTILMGNFQAPALNTTVKVIANIGVTNIYSIPTSAYTGAWIDYTVNNGLSLRAGSLISVFSGTNIQYTETSTNDIGVTSGITFSMIISGSSAIYRASGVTSGWTVKSIIRSI